MNTDHTDGHAAGANAEPLSSEPTDAINLRVDGAATDATHSTSRVGKWAGWTALATGVVVVAVLAVTGNLPLFGKHADAANGTKPPLPREAVAVTVGTVGVGLASAVLHFMLGSTVSASEFFVGMLLPTLALNLLLAYPLYGLCRRLFPVSPRERREPVPVG